MIDVNSLFLLKKQEIIVIVTKIFLIAATEIRCQEKSKGGLCYEVILAEPSPNVVQPPIKRNNYVTKAISVIEIEQKLKEAEDRRLVSSILYLICNKTLNYYFILVIGS